MPTVDTALIVLAGIALFAAFVNGAIGYGFSSLTVPVALLFYTNRILNPAVVVIEVFINVYVLFINRDGVPAVLKRVFPILIGLLPGIAIGAIIVASVHPGWVKLGTYTVILPLILIQAAGWRRPIRSAWTIGLPFGTALRSEEHTSELQSQSNLVCRLLLEKKTPSHFLTPPGSWRQ